MFLLKIHRNFEKTLKCVYPVPTIKHFFNYSQLNTKLRNQSELSDKITQNKTIKNNRKFKVDYAEALTTKSTKSKVNRGHKKTSRKVEATSAATADPFLSQADTIFEEKIERFKLSEAERLKFVSTRQDNQDETTERFKEQVHSNEKDFLVKASFDKRNNLDAVGQEFLSKYKSLNKVTTDPKHLTILHSELAEKFAGLLYDKYGVSNNQKRLFVDFNAGVGFVTQKLIDRFKQNEDDSKKIIAIENVFGQEIKNLIERNSSFKIDHLKPKFKNATYQFNSKDITVFKSSVKEFAQELPPIIYGIIPLNYKGFISNLFNSYLTERFFFEHLSVDGKKIWPEFVLYLSEYQLAKLNLNWNKKYLKLNQQYAIINRFYCESEILCEEDLEYFFPYPHSSMQHRHTNFDFKKMYLVRLKFRSANDPQLLDTLANNKVLFSKFVQYMLKEKLIPLSQILNRICYRNVKRVIVAGNELGGSLKNGMLPINEYEPHQIYCVFNVLYKNPELLSTASSLEEMFTLTMQHEPDKRRSVSLSKIKLLNKEYSGQLVLPSDQKDLDNSQSDKT